MKGDFSRRTFDAKKHYNAVLMQQGRVQLDADWNEQRAIDRHRIETEARDLIGPGGGQVGDAGFEIKVHEGTTLSIGSGNLYVEGILCQNEELEDGETLLFEEQPDLPGTRAIDLLLEGDEEVGLVYLDVWDRHVTGLEDEAIREVALGGPDTATRTKTVWQAKVLPVRTDTSNVRRSLLDEHVGIASRLEDSTGEEAAKLRAALARTNRRILDLLGLDCSSAGDLSAAHPPSTGRLLARALPSATAESPCVLPPSAGYERLENQLYRVEIHDGGERNDATFKWSRDNGSVTTAVLSVKPTGTPTEPRTEIVVRDLGRDETLGFANGQHVELLDDSVELVGQAGPLPRITKVDPATRTIVVNQTLPNVDPDSARTFHYKLRRWDSAGDLVMIPPQDGEFVDLEGGVQVQFFPGRYNTGDYWVIPARTATGGIEWPYEEVRENGQVLQRPLSQPPAGIYHHYSRLALVMAATIGEGERQLLVLADCRRLYSPVTELTSLFYLGGDGQEAGSGQSLPRPLVVGVANGDKPVVGAQVRFEVQAENLNEYDGELKADSDTEADDNTGKSVIATTNAWGEARCFWTLATKGTSQQVRASLVDGTHLSVYFNANLLAPGEAVEETIQIRAVELGEGEQDLRLDAPVPVTTLTKGIRVVCDENSIIDERTVEGKPTCFVTLEIPFPQSAEDKRFWGQDVVGYQPLILAASVTARGNVILWNPFDDSTSPWLETLFQKVETTEILAHLTLKGNFIWDKRRPQAYLDGDTFGVQRSRRVGRADIDVEFPIELEFPSGDGRRGGDFEMWFRLVPQPLVLDTPVLSSTEVTGDTGPVNGTARITGTAPSAGTRIDLSSSNPSVASVLPESVTIDAGGFSAPFQVTTEAVATATTVRIMATLGDQQRFTNLEVQPPVPVNLEVDRPSVVGRTDPARFTVTLNGPAPAGGAEVALSSSEPAIAPVQASVNVPAGRTTEQFQVDTEPVRSNREVTIKATSHNVTSEETFTVVAPRIMRLVISPSEVVGGGPAEGEVELNGPAPEGFVVTLFVEDVEDAREVVTVPPSVTVRPGDMSATFEGVTTRPVTFRHGIGITASRVPGSDTDQLTVLAPRLSDLRFSPSVIRTSGTSKGTITLNGPAPSGTSIALSGSRTDAATFPSSAKVPSGATEVTFTATGRSFTGERFVTVTASYLSGGNRSEVEDTLTVTSGV